MESPYRLLLRHLRLIDETAPPESFAKRVLMVLIDFLVRGEGNASPPVDEMSMEVLGIFVLSELSSKFSKEEASEAQKLLASYFVVIVNFMRHEMDHNDEIEAGKTNL